MESLILGLLAETSIHPGAGRSLGVIDLPDESAGRVEYRTATPNFFALTHYNRSYFYATAVADLAAALAPHRQAVPGVAAK